MVPGTIIKAMNNGAYVMHPSLLPKYRGAAPIQHTLLNREKKAGVTLVEASIGKFDAGCIIAKKEIEIEPFHRFKELAGILSEEGGDIVLDFIYNYDSLVAKKAPQDESQATPAPLIDETDYVYLDFANKPADEIISLYKAFHGSQLTPYTKFTLKGEERRIFFDNLFVVTENNEAYTKFLKNWNKPGSIFWDTKYNVNNVYIRSQTQWFVTTRVKLDKTDFMGCDILIKRVLQNNKFKDKKQTELNFNTLAKV
jgi:methionyl-tRNA formyltransferase